jgi:NADPH2:quinone reductase
LHQQGFRHAADRRAESPPLEHIAPYREVVLRQGRGVDVILDMVAGGYVPRELELLAEDGRLVIIATLGGKDADIDAALIMRRRLTLTGSTLRGRPVAFKAALARQLHERVWPLLEAGQARPVIHRIFPARDAAAAHALMESSQHIGKIMLQW